MSLSGTLEEMHHAQHVQGRNAPHSTQGALLSVSCLLQIIQHTEEVLGEDGDVMSLSGTLEAMHSVDLAHPNVVQTYKSTQKNSSVRCPLLCKLLRPRTPAGKPL